MKSITVMATSMFKKKTFWITASLMITAGLAVFFLTRDSDANEASDNRPSVHAEIGTIVDKALAVGTIQPENEIEVKSKISGVVNRIYADEGDFVKQGNPLFEIRPDPTPLEISEATRNLERTQLERENLKREVDRLQNLRERNLISDQDYENILQRYNDVKIREQINQERLQLLESGRISIGNTVIESVIRAPIDGFILEKMVDVGDPIVPLTSYQAGTPMMTIAAMDNLLFKGSVDEIDVGKLSEGMPVEIKIGALPGAKILGELNRISLKARQQDNATVFPVEITITDTQNHILRAGYSANADIIIHRMQDVITIPERVVTIRDGKNYVEIPGDEPGSRKEIEIELGLSDAITVEVTSGLAEGDKVLEKPVRSLTVR